MAPLGQVATVHQGQGVRRKRDAGRRRHRRGLRQHLPGQRGEIARVAGDQLHPLAGAVHQRREGERRGTVVGPHLVVDAVHDALVVGEAALRSSHVNHARAAATEGPCDAGRIARRHDAARRTTRDRYPSQLDLAGEAARVVVEPFAPGTLGAVQHIDRLVRRLAIRGPDRVLHRIQQSGSRFRLGDHHLLAAVHGVAAQRQQGGHRHRHCSEDTEHCAGSAGMFNPVSRHGRMCRHV